MNFTAFKKVYGSLSVADLNVKITSIQDILALYITTTTTAAADVAAADGDAVADATTATELADEPVADAVADDGAADVVADAVADDGAADGAADGNNNIEFVTEYDALIIDILDEMKKDGRTVPSLHHSDLILKWMYALQEFQNHVISPTYNKAWEMWDECVGLQDCRNTYNSLHHSY